jgi:hypothetical protein
MINKLVLLAKYNWNNKEDQMGIVCSMRGSKRIHIGFWSETEKERVRERIILKWILEEMGWY